MSKGGVSSYGGTTTLRKFGVTLNNEWAFNNDNGTHNSFIVPNNVITTAVGRSPAKWRGPTNSSNQIVQPLTESIRNKYQMKILDKGRVENSSILDSPHASVSHI